MTTTINAKSTGIGGLDVTCDASGSLELQTGGVAALTIDTSQRTAFVAGTAAAPAITRTGDTNTGMFFPAADTIAFAEGGTEAMRLDANGNVGIGTTSPSVKFHTVGTAGSEIARFSIAENNFVYGTVRSSSVSTFFGGADTSVGWSGTLSNHPYVIKTNDTERMRIDSSGGLWLATGQYSTGPATSSTLTGFYFGTSGEFQVSRSGNTSVYINRTTDDGGLVSFRQAGTEEGSISVSGTTVSYNGGHLSRWSQWQNETGKPSVYRGTILESVDAMCEWEKDGEPLPNEQATKTIVSTTLASKAVAGVFDRYDEDDENNPYDFYVAQSGDFVIRIAQNVTVQNGDLLESAGDGTAKPQADDICRSSTVAKVTSNYVSATYEDGSYCVPCILMIG